MKVEIINTVQEWIKLDGAIGTYLVEVSETEGYDGERIVILNKENVRTIVHYFDGRSELSTVTIGFKDAFMQNFE